MQFETTKQEFLKGLQIVQNAISQKSTLPILSNLLIETQKETIKITATDLDIGITSKISVKIVEEGAVTIPAKKLIDIIKELPEGNVNIILKKNNMVTIESGRTHVKIVGLPKEEFPKIPDFKEKEAIVIPQILLKEMLELTNFAVSKDETRYILNGVLFCIKNENLQLVATDGRRLAVVTKTLPEKKNFEKKAIVPSKTVQELLKILTLEGDVKIIFSNNQMFFNFTDINVISKLVEGDFPNYEQVIPKEKKEKIKVDRNVFLAATKRAGLFTNPDSLAIKIDVSKNKMIVSKNTPYIGEVKEEIDTDYSGKNISIGFNPAYIIDVLRSLQDASVEFELEDEDKPGVIRKANEYIYVVLPMQLT